MEPVEVGFFAKFWEWIVKTPGCIWDGYVMIYSDPNAVAALIVLISLG